MAKRRYQYENCIYRDTSSRGAGNKPHDCWRAEIWIDGRRWRKRSHDYGYLIHWISYMRGGGSTESYEELKRLEEVKRVGKDDLAPTEFPTYSRSLMQAAREARANHDASVRRLRVFRMHDYNLKWDK